MDGHHVSFLIRALNRALNRELGRELNKEILLWCMYLAVVRRRTSVVASQSGEKSFHR